MDGQGTTWRRNIVENFNRLSRVHQHYRRQTDGRTLTYSERECVTFAKNQILWTFLLVAVQVSVG